MAGIKNPNLDLGIEYNGINIKGLNRYLKGEKVYANSRYFPIFEDLRKIVTGKIPDLKLIDPGSIFFFCELALEYDNFDALDKLSNFLYGGELDTVLLTYYIKRGKLKQAAEILPIIRTTIPIIGDFLVGIKDKDFLVQLFNSGISVLMPYWIKFSPELLEVVKTYHEGRYDRIHPYNYYFLKGKIQSFRPTSFLEHDLLGKKYRKICPNCKEADFYRQYYCTGDSCNKIICCNLCKSQYPKCSNCDLIVCKKHNIITDCKKMICFYCVVDRCLNCKVALCKSCQYKEVKCSLKDKKVCLRCSKIIPRCHECNGLKCPKHSQRFHKC